MLRMRLERSTEFDPVQAFCTVFSHTLRAKCVCSLRVTEFAQTTLSLKTNASPRAGATPRARGELGGEQLYFLGDLESRALI